MDYLGSLDFLEKIYLMCALFGGGFFLLRTVLMLAGIGGDGDLAGADADAPDGDFDHGHLEDIDAGHHDMHDAGLRLLTVQGLTAFVMMFGLTAFAFSRASFFGSIVTALLGALVGLFAMWLVAKGFSLMRSLQSAGNIRIYDAMGEEGTVYLTIPADGIGKIQLTVSGRLMVVDAVSHDKVALKTGERVCVSEITSGGMLAVRSL